jgi:hypothetical protein
MVKQFARLVFCSLVMAPITVTIGAPDSTVFPLGIDPTGHYLIDRNHKPFFIQGDASWSLTHNLTYEEACRYMEDRRSRGFNTLLVSTPDAYDPDGKASYQPDRYGHQPFRDGDLTQPEEAYWAHVDRVFKRAEESGFLLFVTPAYLGCCNDGYLDLLRKNGPEKCLVYGRWIGKRYADRLNIIWVHGGDRSPFDVAAEVRAIASGIRETAPGHLQTAHWASNTSAFDHFADEGWLDINSSYTYGPVAWRVLYDRACHPMRPTFLIETHYENDFGKRTADDVRKYPYRAILAGAAGHLFGNKPLWFCGRGWENALGSPGSQYMMHVRALFESRAWYDLVPDARHEIIVEGHGDSGSDDGVQAAATRSRDTLIALLPPGHSITVDLERLSGEKLKGYWFDPRTGRPTEIGIIEHKGLHPFRTPPGGEWILVLDDAAANRLPPGIAAGH